MIRRRYLVAGTVLPGTHLLGRTVSPGRELYLTEGEATTPLEKGLVVPGDERDSTPKSARKRRTRS
jgi:hypothetical protein